ncbi:hypothetical protein ACFQYP_36580 [Nonomuraea antimicrobica]
MRVLLVEDDDRLASALTTALARHGHQVARTGLAVDVLRLAGASTSSCWTWGCPTWTGSTCCAACGGCRRCR